MGDIMPKHVIECAWYVHPYSYPAKYVDSSPILLPYYWLCCRLCWYNTHAGDCTCHMSCLARLVTFPSETVASTCDNYYHLN